MKRIDKSLLRAFKFTLISLGILFCFTIQSHATSFSLVKTIDLTPLVGDDGSIEVDVVGDELYVANWRQDKYYRIDPVTEGVLGWFTLGSGILIDNHGSEYNPATGTILHTRDDDAGGYPGFDAFFETDTSGSVVNGPYDLFGLGDNSEDPESLTVDSTTGQIWVSAVSQPGGITEIDPDDGTILNQINIGGAAWALGLNPNSGNLFFADNNGVIWEIAPDGTGLAMVFAPGVGEIYGMAFTPSGDLALLEFAAEGYGIPPPSRLLLYDSSDDIDNVFTTSLAPEAHSVSVDIKPGSYPNCFNINGHGVIPVAILGSDDFDVTQINMSTLEFAGLDVRVKGNSKPQCSVEDVSGDFTNPEGAPDGYDDLVCHFANDSEVWSPYDGIAYLTGELLDGAAIEGSDTICLVPRPEAIILFQEDFDDGILDENVWTHIDPAGGMPKRGSWTIEDGALQIDITEGGFAQNLKLIAPPLPNIPYIIEFDTRTIHDGLGASLIGFYTHWLNWDNWVGHGYRPGYFLIEEWIRSGRVRANRVYPFPDADGTQWHHLKYVRTEDWVALYYDGQLAYHLTHDDFPIIVTGGGHFVFAGGQHGKHQFDNLIIYTLTSPSD